VRSLDLGIKNRGVITNATAGINGAPGLTDLLVEVACKLRRVHAMATEGAPLGAVNIGDPPSETLAGSWLGLRFGVFF
jgi:hypothetical protein